jgi:asparagine synthase (glutamine-hydrolysing)
MSGILGYFGPGVGTAPTTLARMGARMRHHTYQQLDSAPAGRAGALGRLGIGLLNAAPQPVASPDGLVVLVLCGEFYHRPDAHEADEDAALRAYLAGGPDALTRFEGMFTCAVWDERGGDLWVVNDRYGLYPHYYAHSAGAFALAPEIKGVLAAPRLPRTLDRVAVAQYVRFQQLLGERTWVEEVQLFPPATLLRYRPADDRLTLRRYWDWDRNAAQPSSLTLDEATEETIRLFQRAIDAMIRPPLRPGVYLSGGLDGRAIVGFARGRTPPPPAPSARRGVATSTTRRRSPAPPGATTTGSRSMMVAGCANMPTSTSP